MENFKWDDEESWRMEQLKHYDESAKLPITDCKERMNICKACPDLKANFCMNCGCYMPLKSRIKGSTCPKGKW